MVEAAHSRKGNNYFTELLKIYCEEKIFKMNISLKQKIDSIDLSMVKMKMEDPEDGVGFSNDKLNEIEIKYKNFLYMIGLGLESVPTKDIDKMWHYHILDTMAYEKDCKKVFGRFIHHFPYLGLRGDEDEKLLEERFRQTSLEYLSLFNEQYAHCGYPGSYCSDTCIGGARCRSK